MKVLIAISLILGLAYANNHGIDNTDWKLSCECGGTDTKRIIGGQETEEYKYPWIAAVLKKHNYFQFCGGTIITQWHVITAAHCTIGLRPNEIILCFGIHDKHDCYLEIDKRIKENIVEVHEIKVHIAYAISTKVNDISLIVVKDQIIFSDTVGPACFPAKDLYDELANKYLKAMGWGTNEAESTKLMEVDLIGVSHETCKKKHFLNPFQTQLCTLSETGGTCVGDSGGPIIWKDEDVQRYTLVGVISYGPNSCKDNSLPAVNTNVSSFRDWVIQNVQDTGERWMWNMQRQDSRQGNLCMKIKDEPPKYAPTMRFYRK